MPLGLETKESNLQLGTKVDVTIQKILPMGLAVELENGRQGIIRQRELSWSHKRVENWKYYFEPEQEMEAIVLSDEDGYLELSLRLVEDDPWERITNNYDVRQIVEGVVTGIEPYGAFIELEPGITGLLHHTKLPTSVLGRIGDMLWSGDRVQVGIEAIDPDKRRISLTMVNLRMHRWKCLCQVHSLEKALSLQPDALMEDDNTKLVAQFRPFSIVLIEDDKEQRDALATWLQNGGHNLKVAETAEQGATLVEAYHPDIVFSDVGLPDSDGIELIRNLQSSLPQINYILMTDWLRVNQRVSELTELQTKEVNFLVKPLLPEDLEIVFAKLTTNSCNEFDKDDEQDDLSHKSLSNLVGDPTTKNLNAVSPHSPSIGREIRSFLRKLQREYQANKVILFQLNSQQRQIDAPIQIGPATISRAAFTELIHSPVRDVAEDSRYIRIDNVIQRERYLQNLLPLLSFQACVGIPIESSSPDSWALFIFFSNRESINQLTDEQIKIITMSANSLLEQQELRRRMVELQQMAILGVMARGFVHEVNHHLSPLTFGIDSLGEKCQEIGEILAYEPERAKLTMEGANKTLGQLSTSVRNLAKTARSFAEMTLQDQVGMIRVDELVRRSIDLVLDTTEHTNVQIHYHPPERMLYTRAKATQVQQVVVNVVLNALQQISVFRPNASGTIHVWLERILRQQETFIVINIEDDGPGIHKRQWEQIFDLGFTSRSGEGSGMGLYIARSLIEEIGGWISVDSSHLFWGTKMCIGMPVNVA